MIIKQPKFIGIGGEYFCASEEPTACKETWYILIYAFIIAQRERRFDQLSIR